MAQISLKSVTKKFEDRVILDNLSLDFKENKITALLGLSGSGKTTILRVISGLEGIDGGEIYIGNKLATNKQDIILHPSQREIGFIFQDLALWSNMSVYDNIAFGLKIKGVKSIEDEVMDILDYFTISNYANSYPNQLSGGQQQLVAIARSLVVKPKILLMDEPLSSLDSSLKDKMLDLIMELRDRFSVTIIYVTHSKDEANRLADEIINL